MSHNYLCQYLLYTRLTSFILMLFTGFVFFFSPELVFLGFVDVVCKVRSLNSEKVFNGIEWKSCLEFSEWNLSFA